MQFAGYTQQCTAPGLLLGCRRRRGKWQVPKRFDVDVKIDRICDLNRAMHERSSFGELGNAT